MARALDVWPSPVILRHASTGRVHLKNTLADSVDVALRFPKRYEIEPCKVTVAPGAVQIVSVRLAPHVQIGANGFSDFISIKSDFFTQKFEVQVFPQESGVCGLPSPRYHRELWDTYKDRMRFLEEENIALRQHTLPAVCEEGHREIHEDEVESLRAELEVFKAKERQWLHIEQELLNESPDFHDLIESQVACQREEFEIQNAKALKILRSKDEEIGKLKEEQKQWERFMERGEERWRMAFDELRNAEDRQHRMLLDLQKLEQERTDDSHVRDGLAQELKLLRQAKHEGDKQATAAAKEWEETLQQMQQQLSQKKQECERLKCLNEQAADEISALQRSVEIGCSSEFYRLKCELTDAHRALEQTQEELLLTEQVPPLVDDDACPGYNPKLCGLLEAKITRLSRDKEELERRLKAEEDESEALRLEYANDMAQLRKERVAESTQTVCSSFVDIELLRSSALQDFEVSVRAEHLELQQKFHDEVVSLTQQLNSASAKFSEQEDCAKELDAQLKFARAQLLEKEEKWTAAQTALEDECDLVKAELIDKEENFARTKEELRGRIKQEEAKQAQTQLKLAEAESKVRERHAQLCTALQSLESVTNPNEAEKCAYCSTLPETADHAQLMTRLNELTAQVLTLTKQEHAAQAVVTSSREQHTALTLQVEAAERALSALEQKHAALRADELSLKKKLLRAEKERNAARHTATKESDRSEEASRRCRILEEKMTHVNGRERVLKDRIEQMVATHLRQIHHERESALQIAEAATQARVDPAFDGIIASFESHPSPDAEVFAAFVRHLCVIEKKLAVANRRNAMLAQEAVQSPALSFEFLRELDGAPTTVVPDNSAVPHSAAKSSSIKKEKLCEVLHAHCHTLEAMVDSLQEQVRVLRKRTDVLERQKLLQEGFWKQELRHLDAAKEQSVMEKLDSWKTELIERIIQECPTQCSNHIISLELTATSLSDRLTSMQKRLDSQAHLRALIGWDACKEPLADDAPWWMHDYERDTKSMARIAEEVMDFEKHGGRDFEARRAAMREVEEGKKAAEKRCEELRHEMEEKLGAANTRSDVLKKQLDEQTICTERATEANEQISRHLYQLQMELQELQSVSDRCAAQQKMCEDAQSEIAELKRKEQDWHAREKHLREEHREGSQLAEAYAAEMSELRAALVDADQLKLQWMEEKKNHQKQIEEHEHEEMRLKAALKDYDSKEKCAKVQRECVEEETRQRIADVESANAQSEQQLKNEIRKMKEERRQVGEERKARESQKRLFESDRAKWEKEKAALLESAERSKRKYEDDKRSWKLQTVRLEDERVKRDEAHFLVDQERKTLEASLAKSKKQLEKLQADPRLVVKDIADSAAQTELQGSVVASEDFTGLEREKREIEEALRLQKDATQSRQATLSQRLGGLLEAQKALRKKYNVKTVSSGIQASNNTLNNSTQTETERRSCETQCEENATMSVGVQHVADVVDHGCDAMHEDIACASTQTAIVDQADGETQTEEDRRHLDALKRAELLRRHAQEVQAEAQEQMRATSLKLDAAERCNRTLTMEVEALRVDHAGTTEEINELQQTIQAREETWSLKLQARHSEMEKQQTSFAQQHEYTRAEIEGIRTERNELQRLLNDSQRRFESLQQVINQRPKESAEVTKLKLREKELLSIVMETNEQIQERDQERHAFSEVQAQLNEHKVDLRKLSRSVSRERSVNESLREKLTETLSEYQAFEKRARDSEEKLKLCKHELDSKKTLITGLQGKHKELTAQAEEVETWREKHKALMRENQRVSNVLTEVRKEIAVLKGRREEVAHDEDAQLHKTRSLRDEITRKDVLLKQLKAQVRVATEQHTKTEQELVKQKYALAQSHCQRTQLQQQVQYWRLQAQENKIPKEVWQDTMAILNVTKDEVVDFLAVDTK